MKKFVLKDELYKVLKWGLILFVPALITLIGTLGKIYSFDTEKIVLTISAVSTFLGAITGISTYNYKKEGGVKMTTIEEKEVEVTGETTGEEVVEEVKESEGE